MCESAPPAAHPLRPHAQLSPASRAPGRGFRECDITAAAELCQGDNGAPPSECDTSLWDAQAVVFMRHSDSVSVSGISRGGYIYNHKPHSRSHADAFTAVVIVWATHFDSFIAPSHQRDTLLVPRSASPHFKLGKKKKGEFKDVCKECSRSVCGFEI